MDLGRARTHVAPEGEECEKWPTLELLKTGLDE